jgi:hypothetical protein
MMEKLPEAAGILLRVAELEIRFRSDEVVGGDVHGSRCAVLRVRGGADEHE